MLTSVREQKHGVLDVVIPVHEENRPVSPTAGVQGHVQRVLALHVLGHPLGDVAEGQLAQSCAWPTSARRLAGRRARARRHRSVLPLDRSCPLLPALPVEPSTHLDRVVDIPPAFDGPRLLAAELDRSEHPYVGLR